MTRAQEFFRFLRDIGEKINKKEMKRKEKKNEERSRTEESQKKNGENEKPNNERRKNQNFISFKRLKKLNTCAPGLLFLSYEPHSELQYSCLSDLI